MKSLYLSIILALANLLIASGQGAPVDGKKSCGRSVLEKVAMQMQPVKSPSDAMLAYNPLSLGAMVAAASELGTPAFALKICPAEVESLPLPAILHLKNDHYILVNSMGNNKVEVYDPATADYSMSLKELSFLMSGYVLCFTEPAGYKPLSNDDLKNVTGYWDTAGDSNNPPPNNGDPNNRFPIQCGGGGAPVLYVDPVSASIQALDLPMWYKPAYGPEIKFQLYYYTKDQRPSGMTEANYKPLGNNWGLNYCQFYEAIPQISGFSYAVKENMDDDYNIEWWEVISYSNKTIVRPDMTVEKFGTDQVGVSWPNYDILNFDAVGVTLTEKSTGLKYHFNSPLHSKLTSIVDRNGFSIAFGYDSNANLISITDATGQVSTLTNDGQGRIQQIQDPFGRTVQFTYDADGYLASITDMAGNVSTMTYTDANLWDVQTVKSFHVMNSITTPDGTVTLNYNLPTLGGINQPNTAIWVTSGEGEMQYISWTPTSSTMGYTSYMDGKGNIGKYFVNKNLQNITKFVPPVSTSTVNIKYDGVGRRIAFSMGTDSVKFVYDGHSNITQYTDLHNSNWYFFYNSNDDLIGRTDPMGRTLAFTYDENGNVTSRIDGGGSTTITRNGFFQPSSITFPGGNAYHLYYGPSGYLSSIDLPSGNPNLFSFDQFGRLVGKTVNGLQLGYSYDGLGQLEQISFPDGTNETFYYDFRKLMSIVDRQGKSTQFSYSCGLNCNVKGVDGPMGHISFSYDANGNILSQNYNGFITSFSYDNLDRLTCVHNPNGTAKYFTWNKFNNLLTRKDERGIITTFSYDIDRLSGIDYSDNTPDIALTYNDDNEITSVMDATGTTYYNYDFRGSLISKDGPELDDQFQYSYNSDGLITSLSLPGYSETYGYNSNNLLTSVTSNLGITANYSYSPNRLVTGSVYSNGVNTNYSYDEMNQLVNQGTYHQNGSIMSKKSFSYYNGSLINKIIDEEENSFQYFYDYGGQISEEYASCQNGNTLWRNQYTYDGLGNRLNMNKNGIDDYYTYNSMNQLINLNRTMVEITGIISGEVPSSVAIDNIKARISNLGNGQYSFTASNVPLPFSSDSIRVAGVVNGNLSAINGDHAFLSSTSIYPDRSVNVSLRTDVDGIDPLNVNTIHRVRDSITYFYDESGNTTLRILNTDTMKFAYNAENWLTQIEFPDGEKLEYVYDAYGKRDKIFVNNYLFAKYVYNRIFEPVLIKYSNGKSVYVTSGISKGGGISGIIGVSDSQSGNYYFNYNHRGDVTNITNALDSTIFKSDYDAFGNPIHVLGFNPFGNFFSTREYSDSTFLSYFGFRYYNSETSRFMTNDPISLIMIKNYYAINNNNPVNYIDPYGLFYQNCSFPIFGWFGGSFSYGPGGFSFGVTFGPGVGAGCYNFPGDPSGGLSAGANWGTNSINYQNGNFTPGAGLGKWGVTLNYDIGGTWQDWVDLGNSIPAVPNADYSTHHTFGGGF